MPADSRIVFLIGESLVLKLLVIFLGLFRSLDNLGGEGFDEPDFEDVAFGILLDKDLISIGVGLGLKDFEFFFWRFLDWRWRRFIDLDFEFLD